MKAENVAVLYHGGCADGFGAAWAAHQLYGNAATYHAVTFNKDVPQGLEGKDILIVDFSYPRDLLIAIASEASSLLVLDHHKSSQEDLAGLDFAIFDMDRSGAGITWDTLHPGKPRPKLIDYIEDRDLWNWALPNSQEILMVFECVSFDFDIWTDLAKRMDTVDGLEEIRKQGRSLIRYKESMVSKLVKRAYIGRVSRGDKEWLVPVINSSIFQSELGALLCKDYPFAVVWAHGPTGEIRNSLRSNDDGIDVTKVARLFGGGGHSKASGCTTELPFEFIERMPRPDS